MNSMESRAAAQEVVNECRICKDSELPEQMIEPCDCAGSMKYTHKTCLINWVRITQNTECQVCKIEYKCNLVATRQKFWTFIRQESNEVLTMFLVTLLISSIMLISAFLLLRMDVNSYNRMMIARRLGPTTAHRLRRIVNRHEFYLFKVLLVIENLFAFIALWVLFFIAVRDEWNRHIDYTFLDTNA